MSSPPASPPAPANSPSSSPEVANIRRSVDTKRVRSPIKKDNEWQVVHRRRRSKTSPSEPESPSKPESSSEGELDLRLDSDVEFPALGSPSPRIPQDQPTSPRSRRSSSSLSDPFLSGVDAAVKQR